MKAFEFINKFKFYKVDKRNPILNMKKDLRDTMVLRRKVHKLFDTLKCDEWSTLLADNNYREKQFLVMRECYLTFDMIY